MAEVVFFYWVAIFIQFYLLEFVIMVGIQVVVFCIRQCSVCQWVVEVQYLFIDVVCYIVQAKVIRYERMDWCGDMCIVIQVIGYIYIVIFFMFEVSQDFILIFVVFLVVNGIFILWIEMVVRDLFVFF